MLLDLNNVTRLYGIVIGVNDVSLQLPKGAHGLLGPNGAGKTTLLNLITGQLAPTMGSVHVMGIDPKASQTLLRQIGYLPGTEGMYADVSAIEWVTYLTRLQGFGLSESLRLARLALERVQLSEHMHRKISSFSRGMRQRTRLAQAIAHEPEFLILDEPFSGLDPIARHTMTTLLQQWIAEGKSLLIASHVLHEIESLTRSFLLLSGGRLLASGSTEEISSLLSAVPTEVRLKVNNAHLLAADLMRDAMAHSVQLLANDELQVSTPSMARLGQYLCQLAGDGKYLITEMRGSDESLQDVFHSLMKLHRGIA